MLNSTPSQVSVLGDGVVFRCPRGGGGGGGGDDGQVTATYTEEIPLEYFHQRFGLLPRLTVGFGFDGQRRELHESLEGGTDFQVCLSVSSVYVSRFRGIVAVYLSLVSQQDQAG